MLIQKITVKEMALYLEELEACKNDPHCLPLINALDTLCEAPLLIYRMESDSTPYYLPSQLGKCQSLTETCLMSDSQATPNQFHFKWENENYSLPLALLKKIAPNKLYGNYQKLPFSFKFVQTGSWKEKVEKDLEFTSETTYHEIHQHLSRHHQGPLYQLHTELLRTIQNIQVHTNKDKYWVIHSSEPGAGIYLGLKEGVSKNQCLQGKDLSDALNFIPVQVGEAIYIPSGIPHGIGGGALSS